MDVEKVLINGKAYWRYMSLEGDPCLNYCFANKNYRGEFLCMLPFRCVPDTYYTSCDEKPTILGEANANVNCPPPEGSVGSHIKPNGQHMELKADKVKREGGIGKRSYYSFPNGVEAEDICRYLSFNLGNVVKYSCRAGRKDIKKKIEDLRKAKDYLEDEIKRLEEGDD